MPRLRPRPAEPSTPEACPPPHPAGAIRLGADALTGKPFDIAVPGGIAQHVTLLGVTGSGKTTTAVRLAEGAARSGHAVVLVDAKGASLHAAARNLALSCSTPFREVVPGAPGTLGYNPCASGSRAQVADKLVSAFTHGDAAQVYRNISSEAVSIVTGVLRTLGEPVTVRRLRRELDRTRMPGLAHAARERAPDLAQDLADLSKRGGVSAEALEGIRARLGALLHGEYGSVLDGDGPQLDLAAALAGPGITYVSLPALASTQDTALMARVLIQDIKQAAFERLRGPRPAPALLVLDEFAALDDPHQVEDLLRQAREAGVATVVSTQQLPDARTAPRLRATLLGPGVLIAHRVGADDATAVARAVGTVRGVRVTRTYEGGEEVGRRSVQTVDRFAVEPTTLQWLRTGEAVVLSAAMGEQRLATVAVAPPLLDATR